jgi:O-antigen/teichoic acid export membrane protein
MGPWSLAVRETLLATITLLALRWASRYHLTRVFDWQAAKWVWNFGWRMMVSRISEVLFGSFDNLVVGTFLGATSLGHYTLAYRLAFLGQQSLQGPIQNVMFSTFASVQKSRQKLCFGFERVNFWLWRSLVPLGLLVGLTGKDLVVLIYGDKWQLAGTLFQFMFLFLTLIPLHETLKTFLIGCGCINEVVKTRAIQLSLFVPAVIAAAYWGDLLTVVLIVNMSVLLSWSLLARHAGNVVDIDWKYLALRPMIAGVVAGISGLSVSWSMTWSNTLEIVFLKGTIIIVMYSVVLLLIERKALLGEWRIIWTRLGPNMETVSP